METDLLKQEIGVLQKLADFPKPAVSPPSPAPQAIPAPLQPSVSQLQPLSALVSPIPAQTAPIQGTPVPLSPTPTFETLRQQLFQQPLMVKIALGGNLELIQAIGQLENVLTLSLSEAAEILSDKC